MNTPQPEKFVPLSLGIAAAKDRGELRVTVVSNVEKAQAFQALGDKPAAAPALHSSICEPTISLQRDGDRITGIHIECGCGHVIELACTY
jgi:hypothetical protein